MKTSLMIEDSLFRAAKRESEKSGKTISETISTWARVGWRLLSQPKRRGGLRRLRTVNLGGPAALDLRCRRDWMETLER